MKKMDLVEFEDKYPGLKSLSMNLSKKAAEFIKKIKELHELLTSSPIFNSTSISAEDSIFFSPESICFMLSLKKQINELSLYRNQEHFITVLSYLGETEESEFENILFLFFRICEQYEENINNLFKSRLDYTEQQSSINNEPDTCAENIPPHYLKNELPYLINFYYAHMNQLQETLCILNALIDLSPVSQSANLIAEASLTPSESWANPLPLEMKLNILNYLDTEDLTALLVTSKELSNFASISFTERFKKNAEQVIAHLSRINAKEAYQFVKGYRLSHEYRALKNLVEHNLPMSNMEITCYMLTRCDDNLPALHRLIEAYHDTRINDKARAHLLFIIINTPKLNGDDNPLSPFLKRDARELLTVLIKASPQLHLNHFPPGNLRTDPFNDDLSFTSLSHFQFNEGYHSPAAFNEANFFQADLSHTKINRGNLNKANLDSANFQQAEMMASSLQEANVSNTNFYKANLANADFSNASLINTNLRRANLSGAEFINTVITGCDFTGTNLKYALFMNVDMREIDLSQINVECSYLENVLLVPDSACERLENLEVFFSSFEQELATHTPGSQQNLRKHMLKNLKSMLSSDSANASYKKAIVETVFFHYPPELLLSPPYQKDEHPFITLFEEFGFIPKQNKSMLADLPLQKRVVAVLDELDQRIKNDILAAPIIRAQNNILNDLVKRIGYEVKKSCEEDLKLLPKNNSLEEQELVLSIECALQDELAQRIEEELKEWDQPQEPGEGFKQEVKLKLKSKIEKAIRKPRSSLTEWEQPIESQDLADTLKQCLKEAPRVTHINQICELSNHHLHLLQVLYYNASIPERLRELHPLFVNYPQENRQKYTSDARHFASQIFDGELFDIGLLQKIQPEERDTYLYGDEDFAIKGGDRNWNQVKLGGLLLSFRPGGKGSWECQVEIIDFQNKQLKSGFVVGQGRYTSMPSEMFLPFDAMKFYPAATISQYKFYSDFTVEAKRGFALKQWIINYIFATQKGPIPELLSIDQKVIASPSMPHSSKGEKEKQKELISFITDRLRSAFERSGNYFVRELSNYKKLCTTSDDLETLKKAIVNLKSKYETNPDKEWVMAKYICKINDMPGQFYLTLKRIIGLCIQSKDYQKRALSFLLEYAEETKDSNEYFINYVIETIKKIPKLDPRQIVEFYCSLKRSITVGVKHYQLDCQILFWELHIIKKDNPAELITEIITKLYTCLEANKLNNILDPDHTYYRISSEVMEYVIGRLNQLTTPHNADQVAELYERLLQPTVTYNHENIRTIIEKAFNNLRQAKPSEVDNVSQVREFYQELLQQEGTYASNDENCHIEKLIADTFRSLKNPASSSQQGSSTIVTHGLFALPCPQRNNEKEDNTNSIKLP